MRYFICMFALQTKFDHFTIRFREFCYRFTQLNKNFFIQHDFFKSLIRDFLNAALLHCLRTNIIKATILYC